jgi:hypothetical protein
MCDNYFGGGDYVRDFGTFRATGRTPLAALNVLRHFLPHRPFVRCAHCDEARPLAAYPPWIFLRNVLSVADVVGRHLEVNDSSHQQQGWISQHGSLDSLSRA